MKRIEENIILKLSFEFSIEIIHYSEKLEQRRKYVLANQLLKSGTSIGANVREAQNAESLMDFVHKMKIAAKEATETEYWLELCEAAETYPNPDGLKERTLEIAKLLNQIIATSKTKLTNYEFRQTRNSETHSKRTSGWLLYQPWYRHPNTDIKLYS